MGQVLVTVDGDGLTPICPGPRWMTPTVIRNFFILVSDGLVVAEPIIKTM